MYFGTNGVVSLFTNDDAKAKQIRKLVLKFADRFPPIKTLITKYCDFMPHEVLLEGEVVNRRNPPWRKSSRELKDQDYIDLYKYLYPFQGDPLLWVHLNTDYPYSLNGILFFPKLSGSADWENGEIKLYSNLVFVSDSIKEVVPRYLLPLRGVIDSTDIPLNVSRSALQSNRKVRSIANFISLSKFFLNFLLEGSIPNLLALLFLKKFKKLPSLQPISNTVSVDRIL